MSDDSVAATAMLGGRYQRLEVLGRGGDGTVVKARDHQHDRLVALKIRPAASSADSLGREALLSEARTLLALRPHANLPLVRDDFFDSGRYVIVMDWVEGTDLGRILEDHGDPGLTPSVVLDYLGQVAAALDHLHGHSPPVIHGDVKPANLVLTPDRRVVLVDFGIAAVGTGGSAGFQAPEAATGNALTPASDIFGLAATAVTLLTGRPPSEGRPTWEGMAPATGAAFERALRRGLATDPARRPRSAAELVEALAGAVGANLPSGVLTFLLTDVEGSTELWERHPSAMAEALAVHERLIGDAVAINRGWLIKSRGEGDSTLSVFPRASDAVAAALAAQVALVAEEWPPPLDFKVRMALHTGEAELRDGDYYGPTLNRAARLRGLAAGGQTLCSRATADLVADSLPAGALLVEVGDRQLRGMSRDENVHELQSAQVAAPARGRPTATDRPTATRARPPSSVPEALLAGRLAEADRLIEPLDGNPSAPSWAQRFWLDRELDRSAEHRHLLDTMAGRHPESAFLGCLAAMVAADQGDDVTARARLDELDEIRDVSRHPERLACLAALGETCVALGDTERSAWLYELLRPEESSVVTAGTDAVCWGSVSQYLGMLATTLGQFGEAQTHFAAALEKHERMGSPPLEAWTRFRWSEMLSRQAGPGDRSRAADLVGQAQKAAETMGMVRLVRLCQDQSDAVASMRWPLPHPLASTGPFVGRASERQRLRAAWTTASGGALSAAFLAGEPGIGKTRLASELACEVQAAGAMVLFGRCDEELGLAYQPFVEALRGLAACAEEAEFRAWAGRGAAELTRLLPELADRFADLPPVTKGEPESERFALFEAVAELLSGASRSRPVLLVLDDIHWAPTPTLLMLRHVLRTDRLMDVLIVGTYRDTEPDRTEGLAALLADLRRQSGVDRLVLGGLDAAAVAGLVGESALADKIRDETGGNPFFVGEVLRHLADTGGKSVPEGVIEVIGRRLSRLPEHAQRVLTVGAVIGAVFPLGVVEAVTGTDCLDALDQAVAAGLAVEEPDAPGRYSFAHSLVRQALYVGLSAARRARMHRQVGETMEARGDIHGSSLPAVAHHFVEAAADGGAAKAAIYTLAAARRALDDLAHEDAVEWARRGLQALQLEGQPDREVRADLQLVLSQACQNLGDMEGTKAAARAAADDARALGSADRLVTAALLDTYLGVSGQADPVTVALCEEALATLGPDETVRRAELMVGLAFFRAIWQREGDAVLPLAEEAVALAREAGNPRILAKALYQMHFANAGLPPEGSIALADEIIELSRGAAETFSLVAGLRLRIWALVAAGDLPGFLRDLEEMAVLAERQRWRIDLAITDVQRAMLALLNGRFDEVEELADSGLAHAGNDPNYVQTHTTQLLLLRREQGRLAEFLPTVDTDYLNGPGVARRAVVALAYADVGQLDRAKELFQLGVQQSAKAGPRRQRSPSLAVLAELAVLLGERDHADVLYELLGEQQGRMITLATSVGCLGAADRFLGMLAAVLERWDEADKHFESALALEERMQSPPLMARTRYWQARMLLSRDRPGDRERGFDLLAEARASAEELGMALLATQVAGFQQP